jgi:alginate O-acetyltransferase complex protein AlgI
MVFTTHLFVFFFLPFAWMPALALGWAQRRWPARERLLLSAQNLWLLVTSWLFYGWAEPRFLAIMIAVTAVCYAAGRVISQASVERRRYQVLTTAVVVSLGTLGFFKYWDFALTNVSGVSRWLGGPDVAPWGIALPVGISFFTFQALSYCVDVYRREAPAARSFIDFACYIAMFPQLVAGPIVRYVTVAQQLVARRIGMPQLASGIALFSVGFAKKILLANPVGEMAEAAFRAGALSAGAAWWGAAAYALQLYFDFSAYSDMAVGLGRMFGFEFLKNFHSPYRAVNLTDFWRRWHISLSTFLRDYLYVPLGGNRRGPARTYLNLLLVMLLGGLWHGANWTFVLWGAWHGGWLALERWRGRASPWSRLPEPLQIAGTWVVVLIGWVVFRANNLGEACDYLRAMIGAGGAPDVFLGALVFPGAKAWIVPLAGWLAVQPLEAHDWSERITWSKAVAALALLVTALLVMFAQSFSPFLYFQF